MGEAVRTLLQYGKDCGEKKEQLTRGRKKIIFISNRHKYQ